MANSDQLIINNPIDVQTWHDAGLIPEWVDVNKIELDQFYTLPNTAAACFMFTVEMLKSKGEEAGRLFFVEPAAGEGAFSDLFPEERRLALDISPKTLYTQQADYLSWDPTGQIPEGMTSVAMGTPPFGLDGWYAMAFLRKTAEWADYAAFVLPGAFDAQKEGSLNASVSDMEYVGGFSLPSETFYVSGGDDKIKEAVFQIWKSSRKSKLNSQTPGKPGGF